MRTMLFAFLGLFAMTGVATAASGENGMTVLPTKHSFPELVAKLDAAVQAANMGLVTRASASGGAAGRGVKIPGNMVVGVYRNDFAVRMLEASVPAGIEAPIRFYVTENTDGTATLSYRAPSVVFAPYKGGDKLKALAKELDGIFARIAADAVK
jgi:uncharacterized protein (DUF302 family)